MPRLCRSPHAAFLIFALLAAGCLLDDRFPSAGGNTRAIGEERKAAVFIPRAAKKFRRGEDTPRPLVILLHGFTSDGGRHDEFFALSRLVDELDFVLVVPDGEFNAMGVRYWNATANCCDFEERETDDIRYITELIEEASEEHAIDPDRVYLFGHSNGGFLAHSVACQHADLIAGVVSVSASSYTRAKSCNPSSPVSLLHAHGTLDEVIWFNGGILIDDEYPSALALSRRWARYNTCDPRATTRALEPGILQNSAARVMRKSWSSCEAGSHVELWRLGGEGHRPDMIQPEFSRRALTHIFSRAKVHPEDGSRALDVIHKIPASDTPKIEPQDRVGVELEPAEDAR